MENLWISNTNKFQSERQINWSDNIDGFIIIIEKVYALQNTNKFRNKVLS